MRRAGGRSRAPAWSPARVPLRQSRRARVAPRAGAPPDFTVDGDARLLLEVGVLAVSGGLVLGAVNSVGSMVRDSVQQQNMTVRLAARLQAAEMKLLEGGYGEEEAAGARDEIRRMKALLRKLEQEAAQGEGIQMDPRTAAPMNVGTYFLKSFNSLLVNRRANLKDGGAPALQTFVTLTLLFTFCLQLSGLLGLAFDPSRGT